MSEDLNPSTAKRVIKKIESFSDLSIQLRLMLISYSLDYEDSLTNCIFKDGSTLTIEPSGVIRADWLDHSKLLGSADSDVNPMVGRYKKLIIK